MKAPFRAPAARVRARLAGRQRFLFDLLCDAGALGYRQREQDINARHWSGRRDPRRRLMRSLGRKGRTESGARGFETWAAAGERLARSLADEITAARNRRALRVLMSYAPAALAPDCVVPRDPILRAAWKSVLRMHLHLFPGVIRDMGRLAYIDGERLASLRQGAASGLARGRKASGWRPGAAARELAVDRRLVTLAGEALGTPMSPGYQARYLFYTKPGDYIWPHSDDPKYSAQLLICVDRGRAPRVRRGSAFLVFRADGSMERYELLPGAALVVTPGVVHAREPLRRGEWIVMLSIGLVARRRCRPSSTTSSGVARRGRP